MGIPSLLRSAPFFGSLSWAVYHLFSFETAFLLFLHGPQIRQILPPIPGNEALIFGVVTMVMGVWIVIRDGLHVRGVPIIVTGLLFIGWMVISVGWTPSKVVVWDNLRFIPIDLWALFAGACIVASSRERTVRLFVMIMLLALMLAVIGLYIEFVYGSFRFYGYLGGVGVWAVPAYISWGYIVSSGAAFALAITVLSRLGSPRQLMALVVFGICVFFLLIAGGRGPLLGVVLAGLLVTVAKLPRIGNGRFELPQAQIMALWVIALGVAYVGYLFATGQSVYTLSRFLTLLEEADDPLLRSGANRFDQFAGAYRLWLDAPIIGHGLAGFYNLYGAGVEISGNHPHNIILQMLAELGIVGIILFGLFMASGLRHFGFGRLQNDPLALAVLMVFATTFLYTMVAGDISRSYRFFFIIGMFALQPPAETIEEEEDDEETTAAR